MAVTEALIPYNPMPGPDWQISPGARIRRFAALLEEQGSPATVREPRGTDIPRRAGSSGQSTPPHRPSRTCPWWGSTACPPGTRKRRSLIVPLRAPCLLLLLLTFLPAGTPRASGQNSWALANPGADVRQQALRRLPALAEAFAAVQAYHTGTELLPTTGSAFESCASWDPMADCLGEEPDCWRRHNCGVELGKQREELRGEIAAAEARLGGEADVPPEVLDWFAGQGMALALWVGRSGEAERRAAACGGTPWWCGVLQAYTAARAGRLEEAEGRFAAALALMPEDFRCHWAHPGPLAGGAFPVPLPCPGADAAWALLDPLYRTPVNERRLEHWRRLTELLLHGQRLEAAGGLCPPRHHLDVLLHGWLVRRRPRALPTTYGRGENAVPPGILADPLGGGPERWLSPEDDVERSQSLGAPVRPMAVQAGAVWRDEGVVVVMKGHRTPVARALARNGVREVEIPLAAYPDGAGGRAALPGAGAVVSLEGAPGGRGVARWRSGVTLPPQPDGGVALSSLLVLRGGAAPPETDSHLVAAMLPSDTVAGVPLLYWETYGTDPRPVRVTVEAVPEERRGLWERIRGVFGGGSPADVRVAWDATLPEGTARHHLDVALPEGAEAWYTLRVRIVAAGSEGATVVERRVWLRR